MGDSCFNENAVLRPVEVENGGRLMKINET